MTGTEIKNKLLYRMHLASTTAEAEAITDYDALILDEINTALDLISVEPVVTLVEQSVALTTATRKYALTAGTTRVNECFISGRSYGLQRIAPEDVYKYAEIELTGEPWGYWEDNENIFVHPMPNASYTLFVMASGQIPHLAALGDTLYLSGSRPLAPAYCAAIPEFVVWRVCSYEKGDYDYLAGPAEANWGALLQKGWNLDKSRIWRRFGGPIRKAQSPMLRSQFVTVRRG